MDASEIPTIDDIVADYADMDDPMIQEMINRLRDRESAMVVDLGPRIWAKGLDRIINER